MGLSIIGSFTLVGISALEFKVSPSILMQNESSVLTWQRDENAADLRCIDVCWVCLKPRLPPVFRCQFSLCVWGLLSAVNGAVKRKGRVDHSAASHQCPVITLIYNLSQGPSVPEESVSGPALTFNTTSITVQRTLSRSEPWWARGWKRAEGLLENHEISRRTCKKFCFLVFIPFFLLFRSYQPFLFREVGTRREGYEGEKHGCSLWLCPLLVVCPGASCFPSLGFHPLICGLETGWALWCLSWLLRVQHGRDHLYQLECFCS